MIRAVTVLVLALSVHVSFAENSHEHDGLEEHVARWRAEIAGIQSAKVRYREFLQGGSRIRQIRPQDFDVLIATYDLAENPDSLRELANAVLLVPGQFETPWGVETFYLDGTRYRDEHSTQTHVYDGGVSIDVVQSGPEAQLISVNGMPHTPLTHVDFSKLVFSPEKHLARDGSSDRVTGRNGELVYTIRQPDGYSQNLLINADGSVGRLDYLSPAGDRLHTSYYSGYKHFDGDIRFPFVSITADFVAGAVNIFTVRVVEQADFNSEIDDSQFTIPVKKGIGIYDFRRQGDPRVVAKANSSDVTKLQESRITEPVTPKRFSGDHYRNFWIILLNVMFLVVVSAYLIIRKRVRWDAPR